MKKYTDLKTNSEGKVTSELNSVSSVEENQYVPLRLKSSVI